MTARRVDAILLGMIALVTALHVALSLLGVSPDEAAQRLSWIMAR